MQELFDIVNETKLFHVFSLNFFVFTLDYRAIKRLVCATVTANNYKIIARQC